MTITDSLGRPRREFVMTPEQFADMGGEAPPADYDRDNPKPRRTIDDEKVFWGYVRHHPMPVDANVIPALLRLASEHEVTPFSIHWPNSYFPEFTAILRTET